MALGVDHQHGDAQLGEGVGVVRQGLRHDDQLGLQGGGSLHVQLLHGAHLGLLQQLRGGHLVDGAGVRLLLQAHHPVLRPQGDGRVGGDIVAADNGLGRSLQDHLPARLVGEDDLALRLAGALRGGAARGGHAAGRRAARSAGAGGAGQRHGQGQRQGGDSFPCSVFQAFHSFWLLLIRRVQDILSCPASFVKDFPQACVYSLAAGYSLHSRR